MREKLKYFLQDIEEQYMAVRRLVPVSDNQGPYNAESLFGNETETDDEEDEEFEVEWLSSECHQLWHKLWEILRYHCCFWIQQVSVWLKPDKRVTALSFDWK